ncbi:MAG: cysteine desulfurase [Clostridiales bacterium]|nr:cysteine desulfurase [Clostridiales bacterium]
MRIYFDAAATTRPCPEALSAAAGAPFGNPSSWHGLGIEADRAIARAAEVIAGMIGADPGEIVFTSGGTEANNTALLGFAARSRGKSFLLPLGEHPSVAECAARLEKNGFRVIRAAPRPDGTVDPEAFALAVARGTDFAAAITVNNENGAVNDVAALAQAYKRANPLGMFHTDAVQAFGKTPLNVRAMGVDTMSLSAHKIHGLKGCGALYIRKGVIVPPMLSGGAQQNGRRPGTENVPGIAAFAAAARKAAENMSETTRRVRAVRDYLAANLSGVTVNSPENGSPYVLNVSFTGVRAEIMLNALSERGIYVSAGAACSPRTRHKSALRYFGLPPEITGSAIRFSFSGGNTLEEAAAAARIANELYGNLKNAVY